MIKELHGDGVSLSCTREFFRKDDEAVCPDHGFQHPGTLFARRGDFVSAVLENNLCPQESTKPALLRNVLHKDRLDGFAEEVAVSHHLEKGRPHELLE